MGAVDNFTLIAGIASLIGLGIQVFDLFPKYARYRRDIVLLLVGLFFGSVVSSLSRSQIVLRVEELPQVTPMQWLIGAVAAVTAILLLSARVQRDSEHRQETYVVGFLGAGFLAALLIGYGLYNSDGRDERRELTLDEQLLLARHSGNTGNFDRAIDILETAKFGLDESDPRSAAIDAQIEELTQQQIRAN